MIDFFDRLAVVAQITLVLAAGVAAWQISTDREPPFVSVKVYPPAARPGEYVTIDQDVWRDTGRKCNVTFSDWAFFPGIGRKLITPQTDVSWEFIENLERQTPGKLRKRFQIPLEATPGQGVVLTPLGYWCKPIQFFWKIQVLNETPFTVLAP